MADSLWYPSVDDVIAIHDDIVSEYSNTYAGVHNRGDIEFALDYVESGNFGTVPRTIHEKAFHLLRLLVAIIRSSTQTNVLRSTLRSYSTFSTDISSSTTTKLERFSGGSELIRRPSTKQKPSNTCGRTLTRSTSKTRLNNGVLISSGME